ncbi:MAG TPA: folylpolyglutamate synthase/dihydrofolate synthase family protein [Woeseiaceae bacterium]|nr:folylpolyglutamate synthase/dihydrofolate synthase family protein [Woeseiaceae bacterium]
MVQGLTLPQWLTELEQRSPEAIVLGLDRVGAVLGRLAPPLPATVITVGGTNGKGSSVELTQAIFSRAGYVTGAYTSPHILEYNERIRVNGTPATDLDIVAAFERIEAARGDIPLTYFEFGTLAAILVFAERQVEVAVLEVGMGGRLDAVNAIEPSASLITNVGLDHCEWLGSDVETIAVEKAGILRAAKPAVYAARMAPASLVRIAGELGADLRVAGVDYGYEATDESWHWWGRDLRLQGLALPALRGRAQVANAAGVLALLEAAGFADLLTATELNAALAGLCIPGRMQKFRDAHAWVLDVAHNPAAAKIVADGLRDDFAEGPTVAILAMLADKDVEGCVEPLRPLVDHWVAFTADNPRAVPAPELARRVANATNRGCAEAAGVDDAIAVARDLCEPGGRIVATGSFYCVGPVLRALGLYSRP